ncbi:beta-glucoside-specific PTS transporter subunit IIABC [Bacillus chungangensis]|uniref:PTS system beta-glucosides-specific IIC component n=1 Tax=Bacillus chungangensis TaxID=587633 RepID=A0ABT9WXK7_9BACI|nr:beta-glucoside-specific PTS transporter subunit IIABC [Bacillus chungangensis]MDQ0177974.1 PTS system beta-glucosides-specific IIC component [Bacillus chungangensis]
MASHKETAKQVVELIGGKANVVNAWHCFTRLRFNLHDNEKVKLNEIKQIKGVMGAQISGDQLQVIIGNTVAKVYSEVEKLVGSGSGSAAKAGGSEKKEKVISKLMDVISSVFTPIIPAIAGAGVLKGIVTLFVSLKWITKGSDTELVLQLISDSIFYFLPFLLASTTAKKFNVSQYLAIPLAGAYMYPTILDAAKAGADGLIFLGLPLPLVNYSASVIPIILSVWLLSYLVPIIDRFMPNVLKIVFTPALSFLIMIPIQLIAIGPLGHYLGLGLGNLVLWLFSFSPLIGGIFVGATRPIVILTGMHYGLFPILFQNFSQFGYDYLAPINFMSTTAVGATAIGVYLKSRNKNLKSVALSAGVSGIIGVTEPALYGVLVRLKKPLFTAMIAGGIAGGFVSVMGGKAYAFAMPSIISLPVYFGPEFIYVITGFFGSIILAIILTYVIGFDDEPNDTLKKSERSMKQQSAAKEKNVSISSIIKSPMAGAIVSLSEVPDDTFSQEIMGAGIAIQPKDNSIKSPVNGEIISIFPTKHAICLKSTDGIEILIHLGLDTVELNGKGFNILVEEGQKVEEGDLIGTMDIDYVQKAGYSILTPIIVTNSTSYKSILLRKSRGEIYFQEALLTISK